MKLLLLLSRVSRVRLCATPEMAAHQAPPSLGFSRQEHWSGLPFPTPTQESEKWKWSRSVMSNPQRPHGLQPYRLLRPWDLPGKSTGVGCHCLLSWRSILIHLSSFSTVTQSCLSLYDPWTAACQASLSITNSQNLLKLMSIESMMPSSHLILCCPLLLLPPIPPSIRVFSNESILCMRWPKYWSFSFSISPSNIHRQILPMCCQVQNLGVFTYRHISATW